MLSLTALGKGLKIKKRHQCQRLKMSLLLHGSQKTIHLAKLMLFSAGLIGRKTNNENATSVVHNFSLLYTVV